MIGIVSGTNRREALSPKIAEYYKQLLDSEGAATEIIDLRDLPEDFAFSALYDQKGKNPEFQEFQERVNRCEKYVFIVPEYNGSFPGVLKAFIDGLQYPKSFKGKKAAIVGLSSGSQGAALGMSHLVDIFNYLGMHVLARRPRLSNLESSFQNGEFSNKSYGDQLKQQAKELNSF